MNKSSNSKYEYEHHYVFLGLNNKQVPQYPKWMYRQDTVPVLIDNTAVEAEARAKGFDNISAAALSNRNMINFFWDLEDLSQKQLVVFAKDEFGVDLPVQATQETLFRAVCKLAKHAPQNRNRLVLMAHSIQMNYDATLEEIKRLANDNSEYVEREVQKEEFWA